jgi:hypothetical protein
MGESGVIPGNELSYQTIVCIRLLLVEFQLKTAYSCGLFPEIRSHSFFLQASVTKAVSLSVANNSR